MDDDLIQTMRDLPAASRRKVCLSSDAARKTTKFSQDLLDQYGCADSGISGVAVFRFDAFVTEPASHRGIVRWKDV